MPTEIAKLGQPRSIHHNDVLIRQNWVDLLVDVLTKVNLNLSLANGAIGVYPYQIHNGAISTGIKPTGIKNGFVLEPYRGALLICLGFLPLRQCKPGWHRGQSWPWLIQRPLPAEHPPTWE